MKDLINNRYFCIGVFIIAFTIFASITITSFILDKVEPSIDNFIDKEYIAKAIDYTNEIEQLCKQNPDQEFLLVALIGANMGVITKIDSYSKWSVGYRDIITDKIKLALMRGSFQLGLVPLTKSDREKMI